MAIFNLKVVADIQSRRAMEDTFQSQIDRVLAAMEGLVSYNLHHHHTIEASDTVQARSIRANRCSFEKT